MQQKPPLRQPLSRPTSERTKSPRPWLSVLARVTSSAVPIPLLLQHSLQFLQVGRGRRSVHAQLADGNVVFMCPQEMAGFQAKTFEGIGGNEADELYLSSAGDRPSISTGATTSGLNQNPPRHGNQKITPRPRFFPAYEISLI